MLPIERYDIRELRQLRRRLHDLRNTNSGDGAALRLSPGDPEYLSRYLQLQSQEDEAAEIQYVLDYFDRLKVEWTIRMQIAFAVVVAVLIVITAMAIVRLM